MKELAELQKLETLMRVKQRQLVALQARVFDLLRDESRLKGQLADLSHRIGAVVKEGSWV